jgi:hypothetical protein
MNDDRLVVVVTKATMIKLDTRDIFAARFKKLGLTAYGRNNNVAMDNLKSMFNRFIHAHRNAGTLVQRLEQAGVEWSWADEYKGSYEDTNQPDQGEPEQPPLADSRNALVAVQTEELLITAA